jgi:mono/diheme cytochrome c family protein
MKRILLLIATISVFSLLVAAQAAKTDAASTTTIRNVAAPQTSPASGKANFEAYCAACHGVAAKGDGPAAAALKVPPSDLTKLSAGNGGKFPSLHVQQMIRNADGPAHGSKDMPIWGPVFRSISSGNTAQVELRVNNLTKYIETLQGK